MKKKLISLLLIASLLFSLASCAGSKDKIIIALKDSNSLEASGLLAAQEKGYFKDAKLKIEFLITGDAEEKCYNGEAQFAIDAQDHLAVAIAGENAPKVKAVAALIQHSPWGIMSEKEQNILTIRDVSNKVCALRNEAVDKAILREIVYNDNGSFSSIEFLQGNYTNAIDVLQKKTADAVSASALKDGIRASVEGKSYDFLYFRNYNEIFDFYPAVLIGNEGYLAEHGEETKALLQAAAKGYEFAIENPDEAAKIVQKTFTEESEDYLLYGLRQILTEYRAELPAESWGYMDEFRWQSFDLWLYENHVTDVAPSYPAPFTNEYLPLNTESTTD